MANITTISGGGAPITLAEAKTWLRVTSSSEDNDITAIVSAVTDLVEREEKLQLVTATLDEVFDDFPEDNGKIMLGRTPVQSVASVKYIDTSGVTQTLATADYKVDTVSTPARVFPTDGTVWPVVDNQPNAVTIRYDAGFGAASAVPESIKVGIRVMVERLFDDRGARELIRDGSSDMRRFEALVGLHGRPTFV